MNEILTRLSTLWWLKTWLQSTMKDFDMTFHFMWAQNLIAEHYERNLDMNFDIKVAQNLVAKHYERYFDMTFHLKAAQNLVADQYERDFDRILHFKREVEEEKVNWPCSHGDEQK